MVVRVRWLVRGRVRWRGRSRGTGCAGPGPRPMCGRRTRWPRRCRCWARRWRRVWCRGSTWMVRWGRCGRSRGTCWTTPRSWARVDGWFTEASMSLAPMETDKVAKHLLHHLDPDGQDTFDPDSLDRRELSIVVDATGMVVIRGQLDPANGPRSWPRWMRCRRRCRWTRTVELPIPDDRSKGQRQADGLGLMARIALRQLGEGRAETDRPKVVIHLPAGRVRPPRRTDPGVAGPLRLRLHRRSRRHRTSSCSGTRSAPRRRCRGGSSPPATAGV